MDAVEGLDHRRTASEPLKADLVGVLVHDLDVVTIGRRENLDRATSCAAEQGRELAAFGVLVVQNEVGHAVVDVPSSQESRPVVNFSSHCLRLSSMAALTCEARDLTAIANVT